MQPSRSVATITHLLHSGASSVPLIATCKINDVEPQAYLTDVLTKLVNGHLQSRLDELLPWAYALRPSPQLRRPEHGGDLEGLHPRPCRQDPRRD